MIGRNCLVYLFITTAALLSPTAASAIPTIAIDLDPAMAGIQSSLTVTLGASVAVDVVFIGDGLTTFDAVSLDVSFNSSGLVVSASPPAVGDIANQPNVFDSFLAVPLFSGDPVFSLFGVGPASIGGVSLFTLEDSFPVFADGDEVSLFRLSFLTTAIGSTDVSPSTIFFGDFILALDNTPVPVELMGAELEVRSSDVPEPASWLLILTSLAILVRRRRPNFVS